jgi:DNA topoisomerase-3
MKGSGLGTPATRAEIIEKLIRTGYVERERKQLRATAKGCALIALVAEPLRSPELTAAWEQQLKEVEEGARTAETFYQAIVALVRELVPVVAAGPAMTTEEAAAVRPASGRRRGRGPKEGQGERPKVRPAGLGVCPLCGQGEILETHRAFSCSRYREGCGFVVWKEVAGVTLSKGQVGRLLRLGVTERIEGFRAKSGRTFGARLRLGEGSKVVLDFSDAPDAPGPSDRGAPLAGTVALDGCAVPAADPAPVSPPAVAPPLTCPQCGRGRIIEGRRGFGCDRYREGCGFVVWKQIAGRTLTQPQLRDLIQKGRTRLIKGLLDEGGGRFDARLRLDGDWQVVVERLSNGD